MSEPAGQSRAVPSDFFPLDARVLSRDSPPRWGVVVDDGPMPAGLVPVLWDGDFSPMTEHVTALLLVPPPDIATTSPHLAMAGTSGRRWRRSPGVVFLALGDGGTEYGSTEHGAAADGGLEYGDAGG
ncbi:MULTISPECIES: hypothetical protein [Actinoalloteichus]|uniref:Uncharacterized protein n=1 Tax=Actinoalloteichus fjordicus TaxID=1612552 RepID=A0AAC9LEF2_9PSEU|nr:MULTISPECIES: hypothetical protein [Actinoalloteichus]APU14800.1 hypothetical protein UA74_13710 [Actinoalloteichus fjordicus]APU20771.1 hypothetical protein UA75_13805 [Actinoalloteichus sp. GBA129-24]